MGDNDNVRIIDAVMKINASLREEAPDNWAERHARTFAAVKAMFGRMTIEDYQRSFERLQGTKG